MSCPRTDLIVSLACYCYLFDCAVYLVSTRTSGSYWVTLCPAGNLAKKPKCGLFKLRTQLTLGTVEITRKFAQFAYFFLDKKIALKVFAFWPNNINFGPFPQVFHDNYQSQMFELHWVRFRLQSCLMRGSCPLLCLQLTDNTTKQSFTFPIL